MPFCPKCKYEFVEGETECNTCKCKLVESLEDIKEVEEEKSSEEIIEDDTKSTIEEDKGIIEGAQISQENDIDNIAREALSAGYKSSSYRKLSDKYEDIKSSAYTLIFVGSLGLAFLVLEWCDIIPLPISSQTKWLFNSVMGGIFIIFLISGIVSFMHGKQVKIEAEAEDEKIKEILEYAEKKLDKSIIDKDIDTSKQIELLYLDRADVIKENLMHEFEDVDEALIFELTEQIYQKIFE